jgi:hypothetical protein
MRQSFAAAAGIAVLCAVAILGAAGGRALAQDPEPPIIDRYEVNERIGTLPFVPGQAFNFAVPKTIPDSATEVLVAANFSCSLASGKIQSGDLMTWTLWTDIVHFDDSPGKASFQLIMWCAPGQFTTGQVLGWLPISSASRTVYARFDNTAAVPWDQTQSTVKIVSYRN